MEKIRQRKEKVLRLFRCRKIVVVEKKWLLDSICEYELKPLTNYTIEEITTEELRKANYTAPLA